MINITLNNDKNGIELRFNHKLDASVISKIKNAGFRWSNKGKFWYSKQSTEALDFAQELAENEGTFDFEKEINQVNKCTYDLWEMTRTEGIEDNFEKYHIYDKKEITSIIRKHLRERFPMCRWSIRKVDYNSIYVNMLESPFAIDSDEVKAIAHYAYKFAQSYNYDNSDSMSDYFDVNFYGVYESDIVSAHRYEQREATVSEYNMMEDFKEKKTAFEAAEQEREERELQERMVQLEIEKAESAKREEERRNRHGIIESGVVVEEAEYFVLDCDTTNTSKQDTVDGYGNDYNGKIEVKHHRENCKVAKNVYFTEEVYEMFANQLLDDYSFLTGMGGTATDDRRLKSAEDYNMMSSEERKSVEWYNNDCAAIYCDGILKLVINPEGYNYARYVYFVDEESKIVDTYYTAYGISEEEANKYKELAESLEDVSADIILRNALENSWDNENFNEYKQLMKEWIYQNEFPFSADIVRLITILELKTAMYRLLTEVDGMQEQFERANFKENQKITVIRISDFGGISESRGYFTSYECGKYAQYDKAIKLVYRPEGKRNDYYMWLYRDVLIFDGWVTVPENVLWETVNEKSGVLVRKTRFASCDNAQYDAILDYFKENGIKPVVNTYKPQF